MSSDLKRAMNAALKLLALRDRSIREMRTALQKKQFPPEIAEETVGKLCDKKLLDDGRFALRYAESLARNRKVGPHYIGQALVKKGIASEAAEKAVGVIFADPFFQDEKIRELAEKKAKGLKKDLTPRQRKKRIYDFLLRRGFPHEAILKHLNRKNGDDWE